jgi:hypothetical protein
MQTPPSQKDTRKRSYRALPGRGTPEPPPQGTAVILSEDPAALEVAIELIEMRYQQYCARMEMEALFTEGKLKCL